MNQQRLERLTRQILSHGLDGVALVPGPNMVYVSGIHSHLSERPILLFLPADDDPAIIIPTLEAPKAEAAGVPAGRIFAWSDAEGYTGAFQRACAQLVRARQRGEDPAWRDEEPSALPRPYTLGVEALHMRVLELELLQRYAPGLQTAHAEPLLATSRLSKDETELAAMQKAAVVAETALARLLPRLHVGMSEKEIASLLTQELLLAGSEGLPFGPIVSAGPNSASPHAVPTERPIQPGDLLVIDWGAMVDDYPSDITRTFAVGAIDDELSRIYHVVQEANQQGKLAARPGVTGQDVDRAARAVIQAAGYGDYFIHRTGHGLGLEVHEPPYMVEGYTTPLAEGMVFTIEPGIYLPGRGGVRIEDDVVITAGGHHSITSYSRDLTAIG